MSEIVFLVEDDLHAEHLGRFATFDGALREIERVVKIPYGKRPNCAPCSNTTGCRRDYHIVEYDTESESYWKILSNTAIVETSRKGTVWKYYTRPPTRAEAGAPAERGDVQGNG